MTTDFITFKGPFGTIYEQPPISSSDHVDGQATVACWFLDAPDAHPFWPHYMLSMVHLRDIEGQSRPPVKHFPTASHELMLLALNPEVGPWTQETFLETMMSEKATFLMPPNAGFQVDSLTDMQAIHLTRLVARGLVFGLLPIEPDDYRGGHERWKICLRNTIEHIKTGGHPQQPGA